MSRRRARRILVPVAALATLATTSCVGSSVMVLDAFTDGSGVSRCVHMSSTLSTTLSPTGEVTSTANTQARRNSGCANAESGIGPWDHLKGQAYLLFWNGTLWSLCAASLQATTTTAQFVLPNVAHECGTATYRTHGEHWSKRGGINAYGVTLTPTRWFFIWP